MGAYGLGIGEKKIFYFEKWVPIGCPHGYPIGYPLEGPQEPANKIITKWNREEYVQMGALCPHVTCLPGGQ